MTYELVVLKERVQYLVDELGDRIVVGEDWMVDMVQIKITINTSTDLLDVFHAGVRHGIDIMKQKVV